MNRTAGTVLALTATAGCAPTVDILGVYFPAWLVCATAGIALSYCFVSLLGRSAATRQLGQSALLFCSLTVAVAMALWWTFYRGF